MKFTVSSTVFTKFPQAHFGALLIEGINNQKSSPPLVKLLQETVKQSAEKLASLDINSLPQITSWKEIFKSLNLNRDFQPSHLALLKRIKAQKQLPSINPLVDIYNIISLKHLIPIGGHDADKAPEIRIDSTSGQETFKSMGSDDVLKVDADEIAYVFKDKILTRHFVWRQSQTSMVDENTKNVFIPIDNAAGDMDKVQLKQIAQDIAKLVTDHLGGKAKFTIVDQKNPDVDFQKTTNLFNFIKKPSDLKVNGQEIDYILTRGVKQVLPSKEGLKILMQQRKISLFQGFDPTSPSLHIGHLIGIRKLAQFQKLGHQVIFLIGDFTGMIGDPTDKTSARQKLTHEQMLSNLKGYKEQVKNIIDFGGKNPVKIVFNYDWLSKLTFADVVELAAHFTVQQMIERDFYQERLKQNKPIYLHEFMYPLMQGYDSAHMAVDLEIGGNDQMFNLLAGRTLEKAYKNKEKFCLTTKLLTDPTGAKMGKTTGNTVNLTDTPQDVFGKIMALPDSLLTLGFELLTDIDLPKSEPMDAKKILAAEVVKQIHGEPAAKTAQVNFEQTFQKKTPEFNQTIKLKNNFLETLLPITGSNSETKRLIQQKAIDLNNQTVTDFNQPLKAGDKLKVGKKKFYEIN